jgi:DNA-binding PadR family transcriptional regulator
MSDPSTDPDTSTQEGWHRGRRRRETKMRGRGGHFERRGRMRRGEIRSALLAVLTESPGHGYEVMQRLEEKSAGAWRPSPGSVYPTLQMLEDEGLVRSAERDGKRVFEITDEGRDESARRSEEAGGPPWAIAGRANSPVGQLRESVMQVHLAARQVAHAGDEDQLRHAVEIVRDARKQLYRLLAED